MEGIAAGSLLIVIGLILLLGIIMWAVPVRLWITAAASGVYVKLSNLIGMRLRRINPPAIIYPLIAATKSGLDLSIDAMEAHRIGFLEKLADPGMLDAAVEQWVASILAAGPRAIRIQKALIREWERLPIEKAIQAGINACVEAKRTDEPRRLMQLFLDRKKTSKP